MMDDDDDRAPPRRDATNLTPPLHTFPRRGGTLIKIGAAAGTRISPRRGTPGKFWVAGADGHQSGSGAPAQGQPQQPVTAQHLS